MKKRASLKKGSVQTDTHQHTLKRFFAHVTEVASWMVLFLLVSNLLILNHSKTFPTFLYAKKCKTSPITTTL